jgi:LPXTG-motif cell wall-anchored protein
MTPGRQRWFVVAAMLIQLVEMVRNDATGKGVSWLLVISFALFGVVLALSFRRRETQ